MGINEYGRLINSDGSTTEPTKSNFWLGDSNYRIAFDFLVLDDGKVALDSFYGNIKGSRAETFLYEVVTARQAVEAASTLTQDAEKFLKEEGCEDLTGNAEQFIEQLVIQLELGKFIFNPKETPEDIGGVTFSS